MKPDETQAYAQDIARQCTARKIQPMNTPAITLNLLGALLLYAGAVQAAEPQQPASERPLDLSLPHDANALQAWRNKHVLERQNIKRYGSGYEARGLGEGPNSAADTTRRLPTPVHGNGSARGSGPGGGPAGSGGRGR